METEGSRESPWSSHPQLGIWSSLMLVRSHTRDRGLTEVPINISKRTLSPNLSQDLLGDILAGRACPTLNSPAQELAWAPSQLLFPT